jgi:hypothetical protein
VARAVEAARAQVEPAPSGVSEEEPAAAPPAVDAAEADDEEVKPEPEFQEEEFAKELEGLDEQDKMMGDTRHA